LLPADTAQCAELLMGGDGSDRHRHGCRRAELPTGSMDLIGLLAASGCGGWAGGPCTATSTATAANFGVFADLRPRTDDVAQLGGRYTAERPRRPKLTLGVKGSQQVRIRWGTPPSWVDRQMRDGRVGH
jgi:hypothetical protein